MQDRPKHGRIGVQILDYPNFDGCSPGVRGRHAPSGRLPTVWLANDATRPSAWSRITGGLTFNGAKCTFTTAEQGGNHSRTRNGAVMPAGLEKI